MQPFSDETLQTIPWLQVKKGEQWLDMNGIVRYRQSIDTFGIRLQLRLEYR